MIEDLKNRSLDEIRASYLKYLNEQDLSRNTIMTSSTDAFYIWRKQGAHAFWEIIISEDFEALGKSTLLQLLRQHSRGNAEKNMNNYLAHLRRFRRFLESESIVEITETVSVFNKERAVLQTRTERTLPIPSDEQVEFYLSQWEELEDYRLQENALNRLFFELSPNNKDISDILLKVSVLNDFYSTNIFKVFPVAKHILSLQIDNRLKARDVTLVDDIKRVVMSGKTMNFYSFATKYCSHHKPSDYPIYDSYVDEVLRYYRNADQFATFKNDDLKEYPRFKSILDEFRDFYQLNKYSLKELDKYIWLLGKTYFNKYK